MSADVIPLRQGPTVDQAWETFRVAFIEAQAKPNIDNMEKAVDAHREWKQLFLGNGRPAA